MVKAGILGTTGYVGIELLRILQAHSEVEVTLVGVDSYIDQEIADVYPHLQAIVQLKGTKQEAEFFAQQCDVVFAALPHGLAMQMAPIILTAGKKFIDLGADFRLQNPHQYQQWYQHAPASETLLQQAVYGLPEIGLRQKIKSTQLLANPGCYPTSCALAAFPAIKKDLIKLDQIIFDSKSGVSGAGRSPSLNVHFSELTENFKAYNIGGVHRHTPEIEQILSSIANKNITVQFTPHLVPMVRGILTTAYFNLKKSLSTQEALEIYREVYANEPFIRISSLAKLPQTKQVTGSNYCDIGLQVDERTNRLIVISVIDNLIKGAAGQAVQNMNLMFGFPEMMGLKNLVTVYP